MIRFSTPAVRIVAAGALAAVAGLAGAQQDYPSRPIRFVIPYTPGGSTTLLGRLVGQKLTESWGQQVNVDNRGGGNTIIGTEVVAKSPPDGYTILLSSTPFVTNPSMVRTLPYDTIKDFVPIAGIASAEFVLVVHPSIPANSLKEIIALAKSKPGQLNYGSSSTGGPTHLGAVLLEMLAGVKLQHIPYKGGGPAIADLMGGQVQRAFGNPANVISFVKSGKLKAIAVSGETRLPALPQVPTFTESGLQGMQLKNWYGVFAPTGTPNGVTDKLSAEITKILTMPDIREKLASQGLQAFVATPDQLAALVKSDIDRYSKLIKAAGIKIE